MRAWVTCCCLLVAGCGGSQPTSPSAPASLASLVVDAFTVESQFSEGLFRYRPEITVRETTGRSGARVVTMEFSTTDRNLATVPLGSARVAAGGALVLPSDREISSASALSVLRVRLTFVDDGNQPAEITTEHEFPPLPDGPIKGSLAISSFAVRGYTEGARFYYIPSLVVGETTGAANIRVTRVAFRLLDVGAIGAVPVYFNSWTVPSSGSIQLFEEQEYGYAFEIDSLARAERLSVVIGFVDDTGRWGEVSGTANVVR